MKLKGWQIAVLVLGGCAVLFLGWRLMFGGDRIVLTNSYDLIDVETGDIFHVADGTKTRLIMPAKSPVSGKYSLVPVARDADGKWRVSTGDLGQLGAVDVPVKAIDKASGEVLVEPPDPKPYKQ